MLDLRGLKCPLPAMLARKAMVAMPTASTITVLADDPLASVDIPHMCYGEGHAVLHVSSGAGYSAFVVKVRSAKIADEPPAGPNAR